MLTADLVHVRRRGAELSVVPLGPTGRERARDLGSAYLGLARAHLGDTRGALIEACRSLPVAAAERKLAQGLLKLVLDRCSFEEGSDLAAGEVRREVFERAGAARRELAAGGQLDRAALIEAAAGRFGRAAGDIERALFADLPDAHLLSGAALPSPDGLVAEYETAQLQAVLLRAVRVSATIASHAPGAYRHLFRKLKFLRLLHHIERTQRPPGGFRIDIDGPYSLFAQVTKYGLQLALALPAITACEAWSIDADLLWGPERRPLRFRLSGAAPGVGGREREARAVSDEVAALLADVQALGGPWHAEVANAVLDLPGIGVCVPDLAFRRAAGGPPVYLEVLGFWSRSAVWKRVELVRQGLPYPVVFAVSKHLRVSEAALGDDVPGVLYVYGRVMNTRAVLERVEAAADLTGKRR